MGLPSTGSALATSTFVSWPTRVQQFKHGCVSLLLATRTLTEFPLSLFVLPQRPFTSLKLLQLAFLNSATRSNFVRSTILRILGALLVGRLHMWHARQVVRQLCREWQPRGVHLYVKRGVLQTPMVDRASTLPQWQDARRQPRQLWPVLRRRPWLDIKRHLVRGLHHPPLDWDSLIQLG
jgi:hypothetical protein